MDDKFCVLETEQDADLSSNYINSRDLNIRFTMEKDVYHKLPYLDILIYNGDNHLKTTVFRKKTFTGLLINFFSFTASCYKIDLIRALIDRTLRINNTWLGFHAHMGDSIGLFNSDIFQLQSKRCKT